MEDKLISDCSVEELMREIKNRSNYVFLIADDSLITRRLICWEPYQLIGLLDVQKFAALCIVKEAQPEIFKNENDGNLVGTTEQTDTNSDQPGDQTPDGPVEKRRVEQ